MKAKNGKDKLYAEKSATFIVTDKNVYGSYRRVPIYPANALDSRALKVVRNKKFKNIENISHTRLAYNIYKYLKTAKYTEVSDNVRIKYFSDKAYNNNKLLYDSFCRTECLCRFSYILSGFSYSHILRQHYRYDFNDTLEGFIYSLGIPPQEFSKYYKHYKEPDYFGLVPFRELF